MTDCEIELPLLAFKSGGEFMRRGKLGRMFSQLAVDDQQKLWALLAEIANLVTPALEEGGGTVRARTDWLRRTHGIQVSDIAVLLGVSRGTLSGWRDDRWSPSPKHERALKELATLSRDEVEARLARAAKAKRAGGVGKRVGRPSR